MAPLFRNHPYLLSLIINIEIREHRKPEQKHNNNIFPVYYHL